VRLAAGQIRETIQEADRSMRAQVPHFPSHFSLISLSFLSFVFAFSLSFISHICHFTQAYAGLKHEKLLRRQRAQQSAALAGGAVGCGSAYRNAATRSSLERRDIASAKARAQVGFC